jgi:hypothetical protein
LIDAIETGSTGTEILMALRWNLQRIAKANVEMNLGTSVKIQDLTAAISEALGG